MTDQTTAAARERRRALPPTEEPPAPEAPARDRLGRPLTEAQRETLLAQLREERRETEEFRRRIAATLASRALRGGPPTLREMVADLAAHEARLPGVERALPAAAEAAEAAASAADAAEREHAAAYLAASRAAGDCAGDLGDEMPPPGAQYARDGHRAIFPALDENGRVLAGEALGARRLAFEALPAGERRALLARFRSARAAVDPARERWDAAVSARAVATGVRDDLRREWTLLRETEIPRLRGAIARELARLDAGGASDQDVERARRALGDGG